MSELIDLRHLPDTYELPKARWRLLIILGAALAFVVGGFAMASEHDPRGTIVMAVFGAVWLVVMLVAIGRGGVTLDRDGFTYSALLGGKRYSWRDVSEFTFRQVGRSRMILFNDETKVDTPFAKFTRGMMGGYNAGIPAAFIGGKLEDACAAMNAFRARALRR